MGMRQALSKRDTPCAIPILILIMIQVSHVKAAQVPPSERPDQWSLRDSETGDVGVISINNFDVRVTCSTGQNTCDIEFSIFTRIEESDTISQGIEMYITQQPDFETRWKFEVPQETSQFLARIDARRERYLNQINAAIRYGIIDQRWAWYNNDGDSEKAKGDLMDTWQNNHTIPKTEDEDSEDFLLRSVIYNGISTECFGIALCVKEMFQLEGVNAKAYNTSDPNDLDGPGHTVVYLPQIDMTIDVGGYIGYDKRQRSLNFQREALRGVPNPYPLDAWTVIAEIDLVEKPQLFKATKSSIYCTPKAYWLNRFGSELDPKHYSSSVPRASHPELTSSVRKFAGALKTYYQSGSKRPEYLHTVQGGIQILCRELQVGDENEGAGECWMIFSETAFKSFSDTNELSDDDFHKLFEQSWSSHFYDVFVEEDDDNEY